MRPLLLLSAESAHARVCALTSSGTDRLASAKGGADAAIAMLRQWAKDAEASDDADAGRR
jgi:hypothetical protein